MGTNSLLKPYHDLLTKIVNEGIDTGITKALYNQEVAFDLMPLYLFEDGTLSYQLFLPHKRGLKNTSVKYGIAEAIWYRKATQKIDSIVKYGKIWAEMTDDNGNVNSNYGYQIKNNNDVLGLIKDLKGQFDEDGQGVVEFYIANEENQFSRTDCTCNNKIAISLSQQNGKTVLDGNVYARSIDVMFGLPYDAFTFNGFMAMIAEELTQLYDGKKDILLSSLVFNVVNIHWYKRDDISQEALDNLTNDVILTKHTVTPYTNFRQDFTQYNDDDVVAARNYAVDNSFVKEVNVEDRDLSYLDDLMPDALVSGGIRDIEDLKDLIKHLLSISQENTPTKQRVDQVINYLKNDPNDRKTIIINESKDILYVSNINNKYYITFYESSSPTLINKV